MARVLPGLLSWLPERAGRELCVWIGRGGHLLVGRDRRLARENLARVYPGWPRDRVEREARRVFEEIGRTAYDFLRYPALRPETRRGLVGFEGREHLDTALGEGRGAVIVTGHLGNWEILAAALVEAGYPLVALARPLREARLDRALREHRLKMGVRTLSSEALPLQALRHLRGGGFLGILADQRIKRGGVTVDFLGQRTRMTEGPARLAMASGAPLIPLGIHRRPDHTHRVTVLPAIRSASGGDAEALTQDVARALEGLILRTPEQWIWIHPRWKGPAPRAAEAPTRSWLGERPGEGGPTCVSG